MDLPSSSLLDTNNLVSILKIGTLQNELLYLGILKWFGEIVWRYWRCNYNPKIEEEQTTQRQH
jgi:hypothetical protein